jgi:hypothetical protein
MFSLLEHILFSVQALPIVIVILVVFVMTVPIIVRETIPRSEVKNTEDTSKKKLLAYGGIGALAVGVFASLYFAVFALIELYKNTPEGLLVVIIAVACLFSFFVAPQSRRREVVILIAMLMSLTVSFAFGFSSGRAYFNAETPAIIKLKSGSPISVRVIRSGDRGVLLYDPIEKRLRFELWDAISSIEVPAERQAP